MKVILRKEAIEIGQKWFFDGVPCRNGHIDKKSVSRWKCYECSRIHKKELLKELKKDEHKYNAYLDKKKKYYNDNKEEISKRVKLKYESVKPKRKEYFKNYYIKNRDKLLARSYEHFVKNKDKIKEYKRQWNKTETGIINRKKAKANRRSKEKSAGNIKKSELKKLLLLSDKCYWCGCNIAKNKSNSFHFDHYIPIAKGGLNTIDNIVLSCAKCNMSKKDKDPHEFAMRIGRLL